MKIPQPPPPLSELFAEFTRERMVPVLEFVAQPPLQADYLHWDKLRRQPAPAGLNHRQWWLALKIGRRGKEIDLRDKKGRAFSYTVPDCIHSDLHEIDLGSGGMVGIPDSPITNPSTRDRYLVSSLMEEAITSSQLEGAVTTREIAKEMLRTGRSPRDTSERMILNNFRTMQHIQALKDQPLSPELLFEVHRLLTDGTLDDPSAGGRFRRDDEPIAVSDAYGNVFHDPPPAGELPERLASMCAFANHHSPDFFIHPAVRAIILHFWLAYDHPFVDGNGRTARALFYWSMLRSRYWLFEFISISTILRKAPTKYARSFLYTETDDNDLTYFLVAQAKVIRAAIVELHAYLDRKAAETRELEAHVRTLHLFNHRQAELIRHALKHPSQRYMIQSHQTSHGVSYQTARTDLLDLAMRKVLNQHLLGKKLVFTPAADLTSTLADLSTS